MDRKIKFWDRVANIIIILLIILLIGGITFAFYNYTRTGAANNFKVGRISFVTHQNATINLTNVFPVSRSLVDNDTDNVGTVSISVTGDTDYARGLEYIISAVDVSQTTINDIVIPISIDIDVDDMGTETNNYFLVREATQESIYQNLASDFIVGEQPLLVGFIVPNANLGTADGIDGEITIKAFFDDSIIAISDTYNGQETDLMGTTNDWVHERIVLTTEEWNSLVSSGISFKIKVMSSEGIWVEEPQTVTPVNIIEELTNYYLAREGESHLASPLALNLTSTGNDVYTFTHNNETFEATYTEDNWKIEDSYKITNRQDMAIICQVLSTTHPIHGSDMESYRTVEDMVYEWVQHNIAYMLLPNDNPWKNNVKDVDLDPADQGKSLVDLYEERTGLPFDAEYFLAQMGN